MSCWFQLAHTPIMEILLEHPKVENSYWEIMMNGFGFVSRI